QSKGKRWRRCAIAIRSRTYANALPPCSKLRMARVQTTSHTMACTNRLRSIKSTLGSTATSAMASVAYIFAKDADAKRPFPPLSPQQARASLLDTLAQSPHVYGMTRSRWTLQALLQHCEQWLRTTTQAGIYRVLQRLGLPYKRGRLSVHSPDPAYLDKRRRICEIEALVRSEPQRFVLLYLDEFTYTRQPTLANAYAPKGHDQVTARLGYR